ncbi:MAG: D-alanyl-D-alanine carboxypeptidase [Clostridia bacterium]|nr:D-alanyl-D-alanine carboxypeptidase [Clostridia bacterium]
MLKKLTALVLAVLLANTYVPAAQAREYPELAMDCKAALLMEYESGEVLYAKNEHEPMPMASVTKIMSVLLVVEAIEAGNVSLDDVVTASTHASSMGGSQIYLRENEQMPLRDMLKSVIVASANDACVALGEHVAGSEDEFVARMNRRAAELGMKDTNFVNCTGLDAEGHRSTAYDIALMSRELLGHELIFDYTTIWTDSVRDGEFGLTNTNKLIRFYQGANGLKTGSTNGAMYCVSAAAKRDGMQLIAVVLGSSSGAARFEAAKTMLNYGFANFRLLPLEKPEIPDVPVHGGVAEQVIADTVLPKSLLVEKSFSKQPECEITLPERLEAPVEAGDEIGTVIWKAGGEAVYSAGIYAAQTVEERSFGFCLIELLKKFIMI